MLFKDGGQRKQASLASDSYSYCKLATITKQNYSCKLKSQSSKFPCVSNMGQSARRHLSIWEILLEVVSVESYSFFPLFLIVEFLICDPVCLETTTVCLTYACT